MKLAVSSIAWPRELDEAVAEALRGVAAGIEIAPTRYWSALDEVPAGEAAAVGRAWIERGLPVVAAQALLYGRPDLLIFTDRAARRKTLEYLKRAVETSALCGARVAVFGSPRNRVVGQWNEREWRAVGREFFRELAQAARDCGLVIGLEANPPEYGADWMTRGEDVIEFVREVGEPGLRFHLDLACAGLVGEDAAELARRGADLLAHVHVSERDLAPVRELTEPIRSLVSALRRTSYGDWVSIEMRPLEGDALDGVVRAARMVERALAEDP